MPDKWSQFAVSQPQDNGGADKWAAFAQPNIPPPAPAPAGNTIQAAPEPSILDRLRGTVANSAVGHSLESGLPKVADALNLHPTETVNSPTYQSDRQNLIAPQYLMPGNPQTQPGQKVKALLTGVGNLTNPKIAATGAGIGVAAGLAAPLAPVAIPAALAATGIVLGGGGAIKNATDAQSQYDQGNVDAGNAATSNIPLNMLMLLGSAGIKLPEATTGSGEGGIGSAIRTAAIGNPDVPLTRGLGITARTKTGLSALQASGEAAPTDVSLEDAQGARPYGQGAKNLEDLQGKLAAARTEINAPLNTALDAIGNRPVQGPDGMTTISSLEAERSQLSAQLRGLQQKDPLAIQTALQKGQGEADLQARYKAVVDAMTPELDSTGIDSRLIRQQDAQVASIYSRIAGRTTLPEATKPYGFARVGDLAKLGNGSGIDLLAPVKTLGSVTRDIAAGRYWSDRPTDVNIREGFRLAGPKPDFGTPQPNLTTPAPLGLPAPARNATYGPAIPLTDGNPFVRSPEAIPIPQFSKPLGLPSRTPSLGIPLSSYPDIFPNQLPGGTSLSTKGPRMPPTLAAILRKAGR